LIKLDRNERHKESLKAKKKRLIDSLIYKEILTDKRLIKAFIDIPLEHFIPEEFMDKAKLYEDSPNLFYYDNPRSYRTISAPHMITIMLQGLNLEEDDDLLILGAKSGYIAALAHQLAPKGEIIILEANSDIAKLTSENLKKLKLNTRVSIIVKNPLNGAPDLCPWQKILVTGAIEQQKIYPLLNQLDAKGGVLFAPIGPSKTHLDHQDYTQILRQDEEFFGNKQLPVKFSPLITQLELDELELITDFEKFGFKETESSPSKNEANLSEKKIIIRYTSNILENITPEVRTKSLDENERELVIKYFENIAEVVKSLKLEEDINEMFVKIDVIDETLEKLRKYKRDFQLTIKKMQNRLNQIRSYNIVRKELEKKNLTDPAVLEQKVSVINQQIFEINHLMALIKGEIEKIKTII
jgi:protein-L-isoaspartate(D-aspartate) O-methyltransferase